jgi:hypothetical protein
MMMKKTCLLALVVSLAGFGCGDDGGGADTGTPDAGDTGTPMGSCYFGDEQSPPCCYRTSNADRLDSPALRVSGVQLSTPPSLSSIIVTQLLVDALNEELFNWLILAEVSGTTAEITTGYGEKNADSSFSFTMGSASPPGDPDRWNPVTVTGAIDGETVSTPVLDSTFTVPVLTEDGSAVQLELPLRNLSVTMATLTEERSCVGVTQPGGRWDTSQGRVTAYITTVDADAGRLQVPEAGIDTTLCLFTANIPMSTEGESCFNVDQAEWDIQPDALCPDDSACQQDPGDGSVCDPATTCNAWYIDAGFAAQGVTISG